MLNSAQARPRYYVHLVLSRAPLVTSICRGGPYFDLPAAWEAAAMLRCESLRRDEPRTYIAGEMCLQIA